MIKRNALVILFLFFSFGIFSQSKIAHINTYELINSMPEKLEAEKILEKYYKERDAEISAMEAELSFKAEQYARESMSKTKQERDEMVEEIQGMEENISLYMEEINKQMSIHFSCLKNFLVGYTHFHLNGSVKLLFLECRGRKF